MQVDSLMNSPWTRQLGKICAALCLTLAASACGDDSLRQRVDVSENPEPDPSPQTPPEPEPQPDDNNDGPPDLPVIDSNNENNEDNNDEGPACSLEDGVAPNQSDNAAAELGTDVDREDLYICSGAPDWYRFELEEGQRILAFVEFQARFGDLDIYLYEEGRTSRQEAVAESTSPDQSEFIDFTSQAGGTYLLEVEGFDGSENQYRLFLKLGCGNDLDCPEGRACNLRFGYCSAPPELDCGIDEGLEPNETVATATELRPGDEPAALSDIKICPADVDHYAVDVPPNSGLLIALEHPSNQDLDALLFNEDGQPFGEGTERQGGEDLSGLFLPSGRYIILIDQLGFDGSSPTTYDLSVELREGSCGSDIDCAAVPGREFCDTESGNCEGITSDGGQEYGDVCDDDGDCSEETDGCYEGSPGGGDNICTILCDEDAECSDLSEGAYCQVIDPVGQVAICVHACERDFDCSADLLCDVESGRCTSRACNVDTQCEREGDSCLHDDTSQGGLCRDYGLDQDHECGVGVAPDDTDNGSSSRAALVEVQNGAFFEGLSLCDNDEDWFVIEIEGASNLTTDVDHGGSADLDVYLYSEEGRLIGSGTEPDANPEQALATSVAAGRYFIRVNKFPTNGGDAEVTYTLSINIGPTDCRLEEGACDDTQPLRLSCDEETGACVDFQGNGEVPLGESCDSSDDCTQEADFCFTFQGASEDRNICSHYCRSSQECNDVPETQCVPIRRDLGVCIRP